MIFSDYLLKNIFSCSSKFSYFSAIRNSYCVVANLCLVLFSLLLTIFYFCSSFLVKYKGLKLCR